VPIIDSSSSNGSPRTEKQSDKLELEFEIVEPRLSHESLLETEDSDVRRLGLENDSCLIPLAIGLSINSDSIVIESLGLVTSLANIFKCFVLKRLV
jgi:hypothetical protein